MREGASKWSLAADYGVSVTTKTAFCDIFVIDLKYILFHVCVVFVSIIVV
jgi:hypothetical protein